MEQKLLSDDARVIHARSKHRDREQCTRFIRAASSAAEKRKGEKKEKEEKQKRKKKKKLSLESIAFIIRESHDNEKVPHVHSYFERYT